MVMADFYEYAFMKGRHKDEGRKSWGGMLGRLASAGLDLAVGWASEDRMGQN
jgi:hypothetical protein